MKVEVWDVVDKGKAKKKLEGLKLANEKEASSALGIIFDVFVFVCITFPLDYNKCLLASAFYFICTVSVDF